MIEVSKFEYTVSSDPVDDILLAEICDQDRKDVIAVGLSGNTKTFWYWVANDTERSFGDLQFREIIQRAKAQLLSHDANTPRDEYWDYVTFQGLGAPIEIKKSAKEDSLEVKVRGERLFLISWHTGKKVWTLYPSQDSVLIAEADFESLLSAVETLTT